MAAPSYKFQLTGDVKEFKKFIDPVSFKNNSERIFRKATLRVCLYLVKMVQINIKQGSNFTKNAPLTLALKRSNRPLIDELNLVHAIEHQINSSFQAEVGVFANSLSTGSKGRGGITKIDMQKLVALHEKGYLIKVTPKMRVALMAAMTGKDKRTRNTDRKKITDLRDNTVYRVPPRKILTSVWSKPGVAKELQTIWRTALEELFKAQGAKDGEHRDR